MGYEHLDSSEGSVSRVSPDMKRYQFLIFCIPIVVIFVLLFLFYFLYLRRRSADWSSIRMRISPALINNHTSSSQSEVGLKKECREMLPIIVYNDKFFITDTLCSVCLGEYKKEDKLLKIPSCGHVFHLDCIDHWLCNHTTCPLCRLNVLSPTEPPHIKVEIRLELTNEQRDRATPRDSNQACQHTTPPV